MPDIRPSQSSWQLVDTLKRVWDVRAFYVPIRIAVSRSLLSGDLPNPDDYPADGWAIDTQQILSAGEADYAPLFRALISSSKTGRCSKTRIIGWTTSSNSRHPAWSSARQRWRTCRQGKH